MSPAGHLPLDQFGIPLTPVGDEEFVAFDTPAFTFANRTHLRLGQLERFRQGGQRRGPRQQLLQPATVTSGTPSFAGSATTTAVTDSAGRATAPTLTAGGTAGPVTVTASVPGATVATLALSVTRTAATIGAVAAAGQSTTVGQPFAQPLVASVAALDQQHLATAPTLTAGSSAGSVTVTATTPGVTQSVSYPLTVSAASADLSAALTAPGTIRPGTPFTVSLVVRNAGPSTATAVASGVALPASTRITNGGGRLVSRDGRAVAFVRASLPAGQSVTSTVTVVADGANGTRNLTAATVSAQVRDPVTANNATRTTVVVRRYRGLGRSSRGAASREPFGRRRTLTPS